MGYESIAFSDLSCRIAVSLFASGRKPCTFLQMFFAQKVIGHVGRIVDELSLLAGLSIEIQVHGIISTRGAIRKLGVMSKKQGRIHVHPSRVLVGTPLKTHRFLYQASNLHHRDHQFIEVVSLSCHRRAFSSTWDS